MTEVHFYHLQRAPLDAALPKLLEKVLGAGARAMVRVPDAPLADHLDQVLWTYDRQSFLPHGTEQSRWPDRQPILLTTRSQNVNQATMLVLINNADKPDDWQRYDRVLYMFDGRDQDITARAREDWKAFRDKASKLCYWQQGEQGGWQQKA